MIQDILGAFLDVYNQYANGPQHRFNINFQLGNSRGVLRGQYRTIQSKGLCKLQALTFLYPKQLTYCLFSVPRCKSRLRAQIIGSETDGPFCASTVPITLTGFCSKGFVLTNKSLSLAGFFFYWFTCFIFNSMGRAAQHVEMISFFLPIDISTTLLCKLLLQTLAFQNILLIMSIYFVRLPILHSV